MIRSPVDAVIILFVAILFAACIRIIIGFFKSPKRGRKEGEEEEDG